jgi:hypothetical protein
VAISEPWLVNWREQYQMWPERDRFKQTY